MLVTLGTYKVTKQNQRTRVFGLNVGANYLIDFKKPL